MWGWGYWWHSVHDANLRQSVDELRQDALRRLIWLAGAGYMLWHFARPFDPSTRAQPLETSFRYWLVFAVVLAGLGAAAGLQRRRSLLAIPCFLAASLVSILAALWLLASPQPLILLPMIALSAVVLAHPAAALGLIVLAATSALVLRAAGPLAFLPDDRLIETGLASLLAVAIAWTFGRGLVTAVEWSTASNATAWKRTEEARRHRAELVLALEQLDIANHRLARANAALELAWKAAEDAERSRAEFVTNISHELRTPLNLIAGFSELILTSPESYGQQPLPAAYRGDLNTIYRNARHVLTLANDIIDLARVGMGHLALAREPVELGSVVDEASEIVRRYIEAKGLQLTADVSAELPTLHVDRLRVRQVLLNLLTNAARFTERGGISILVTRDVGEVRVAVSDTGPGIAPDDLTRVFDEYYHGRPGAGEEASGLGGVGLGLALSKRFVELHRGRMGVESRLGEGTTFWFTLPIDGSGPVPTSRDTAHPAHRPALASDTERVLVLVSRDAAVAEFLQHHLNDCRTVVTPDLSSAVRAAVDLRALAILTDIETDETAARHGAATVHAGAGRDETGPAPPGVNGEVADDIASPVPIVRLPLPRSDRLAAALGADACLAKPIERRELAATLDRIDRTIQRVLVVDDDPDFVRLITRMLRANLRTSDATIHGAHTGREALAAIESSFEPDVILLDLSMPEMTGAELLAHLRGSGDRVDLPVILISGQDQLAGQTVHEGRLSLEKAEGFGLEEILDLVDAILGALRPPRHYLSAPVR